MAKININFDINKFLESRRDRKRNKYLSKIQNICPHIFNFNFLEKGKLEIEPAIISPIGTMQAQCNKCQKIFPSYELGERELDIILNKSPKDKII